MMKPMERKYTLVSVWIKCHTGKEDILTPKQKKYLVAFLKEESKNKRYKTNWEYALSMWNDNNTDKPQVDETSEVLDYTQLKD